jgi:hypothetical protein
VVQTNDFAGEINIFDIEDPTDKQMKYARFLGRIVKTSESKLTYTGLLIYVAKAVFDIAPTDFINKLAYELNAGMELTSTRRPRNISDSYSIETNLSAKEIFKRIRIILSKFGLEDELYICFQENDVNINNN